MKLTGKEVYEALGTLTGQYSVVPNSKPEPIEDPLIKRRAPSTWYMWCGRAHRALSSVYLDLREAADKLDRDLAEERAKRHDIDEQLDKAKDDAETERLRQHRTEIEAQITEIETQQKALNGEEVELDIPGPFPVKLLGRLEMSGEEASGLGRLLDGLPKELEAAMKP